MLSLRHTCTFKTFRKHIKIHCSFKTHCAFTCRQFLLPSQIVSTEMFYWKHITYSFLKLFNIWNVFQTPYFYTVILTQNVFRNVLVLMSDHGLDSETFQTKMFRLKNIKNGFRLNPVWNMQLPLGLLRLDWRVYWYCKIVLTIIIFWREGFFLPDWTNQNMFLPLWIFLH
jgi:hypothetical protein